MTFVFQFAGPFGSPTRMPVDAADLAAARAKLNGYSRGQLGDSPVVATYASHAEYLAANPSHRAALAAAGVLPHHRDN